MLIRRRTCRATYSSEVQQPCRPASTTCDRDSPLNVRERPPVPPMRLVRIEGVIAARSRELHLHRLRRAHPVLTVEEEAVEVNPAVKPSRATRRRIGQVLDDYTDTDWRNGYRRRQLRADLAELTGDPEEPVRAAKRLIRPDRKARARQRRSASQARRARAQNAQWSAPNGLARPRQPDAKCITHVIPTPVETDRRRH
jgi:hypothetical protein